MSFYVTGALVEQKDAGNAYFASNPKHQPDRAQLLLEAMGFTDVDGGEMSETILDAMQPLSGQIAIGAFRHGAFVSDVNLADFIEAKDLTSLEKWIAPAMQHYPDSRGYIWHVNESVNAYGYAYFEEGVLLRAMFGNINEDITVDFGTSLPDEVRFGLIDFAGKKMMVEGAFEKPFESADGCDLAFALTASFCGVPLNQFVGNLEVEFFDL